MLQNPYNAATGSHENKKVQALPISVAYGNLISVGQVHYIYMVSNNMWGWCPQVFGTQFNSLIFKFKYFAGFTHLSNLFIS